MIKLPIQMEQGLEGPAWATCMCPNRCRWRCVVGEREARERGERERREREARERGGRETRGYEPLALHAAPYGRLCWGVGSRRLRAGRGGVWLLVWGGVARGRVRGAGWGMAWSGGRFGRFHDLLPGNIEEGVDWRIDQPRQQLAWLLLHSLLPAKAAAGLASCCQPRIIKSCAFFEPFVHYN